MEFVLVCVTVHRHLQSYSSCRFNKIRRTYLQENGREPSHAELAKELNIDEKKIKHIIKIAKEPISLETPVGDSESDAYIKDFIENENEPSFPITTESFGVTCIAESSSK